MMGELFREKYTKEQFKEKLENAMYVHPDYGLELQLKEASEDTCFLDYENDPFYYELTKPDIYFPGFVFKEILTLDYEDEDYICFEYDGGSFRISDYDSYFAVYCGELETYIRFRNKEIERLRSLLLEIRDMQPYIGIKNKINQALEKGDVE